MVYAFFKEMLEGSNVGDKLRLCHPPEHVHKILGVVEIIIRIYVRERRNCDGKNKLLWWATWRSFSLL